MASATVILREDEDFAGFNEEWLRWFPVDPPARQAAERFGTRDVGYTSHYRSLRR